MCRDRTKRRSHYVAGLAFFQLLYAYINADLC
jgi:hypothetical protein